MTQPQERLRSGTFGFNELGGSDKEQERRIAAQIAAEPTPARVGPPAGEWDHNHDSMPSLDLLDELGPRPVDPRTGLPITLRSGSVPGSPDPWEQRAELHRIADEVYAERHIIDQRKPWERVG